MPKNRPLPKPAPPPIPFELRAVVSANVAAVMDEKGLSQPGVSAAAKRKGFKIDATTVGRIRRGVFPTTIDTLEALAAGLGVQPWQLLIPAGVVAEKLLVILHAWAQSTESGRELLLIAARGALANDSDPE